MFGTSSNKSFDKLNANHKEMFSLLRLSVPTGAVSNLDIWYRVQSTSTINLLLLFRPSVSVSKACTRSISTSRWGRLWDPIMICYLDCFALTGFKFWNEEFHNYLLNNNYYHDPIIYLLLLKKKIEFLYLFLFFAK